MNPNTNSKGSGFPLHVKILFSVWRINAEQLNKKKKKSEKGVIETEAYKIPQMERIVLVVTATDNGAKARKNLKIITF